MSKRARQRKDARPWEAPERTGWPPGLLQDDSRGLSKWLASKPDARMLAREAAWSSMDEARLGDWSDGCGEGEEDDDDEADQH